MPNEFDEADGLLTGDVITVVGRTQETPITVTDSDDDVTVGDDETAVEIKRGPKRKVRVAKDPDDDDDDDDDDDRDADDDNDDDDDRTPIVKAAKFDRHDLAMAHDLGVTVEEVRECETSAELKAVIRTAARRRKEPVVEKGKAESGDGYDFNAMFGVSKDEEDLIDPDVLKVQKKIAEKIANELKEVKAIRGEIKADREARQQEFEKRTIRVIDRTFNKMCQEKIFGPAEFEMRTPAQMARRKAVLQMVDWKSGVSVADQVKAAVKLVYPAVGQGERATGSSKPTREQKRKRRWEGGAVATPNGRKDKPKDTQKSRLKEAEKKVSQVLAERGTLPSSIRVHDDDDEGSV